MEIRKLSIVKFVMFVSFMVAFSLGCGGGDTSGLFPNSGVSVNLSWQAPMINEDGSDLRDLAGYRVYYGTSSGKYTNVINIGNFTSSSIGELLIGSTYYFVVTAYDISGNESDFSDEKWATISEL